MSITEKAGSFALDIIAREQNNIKSQAALIELAKASIAKSEARIKAWSQPEHVASCRCNACWDKMA